VSGKSSLAFDTLYAEGQRRYIESFSAYTRQFLQRLEKPEAERIDGIPPAIAVTHQASNRSSRSTVGTATEILDYLRLLFARIGQSHCPGCGVEIHRETSQSVARRLQALPERTRYMVGFPRSLDGQELTETATRLQEDGFVRMVLGERLLDLVRDAASWEQPGSAHSIEVIVDRLAAGPGSGG
jgi:excinuclease ABC subunit A